VIPVVHRQSKFGTDVDRWLNGSQLEAGTGSGPYVLSNCRLYASRKPEIPRKLR
jgi:hypothetical protein